MMILEKKGHDFTDYISSKKGVDEKEDICNKYVKSFWLYEIICHTNDYHTIKSWENQ